MQDQQYSFTPTASDPNGDALTFSITNTPPWATFNTSSGRLSGTPTLGANVGEHPVRFTVADATSRVPAQVALTVIAAGHVDLAVTLSVAPTPVELEAPVTWTVAIANRAANVKRRDAFCDLPASHRQR